MKHLIVIILVACLSFASHAGPAIGVDLSTNVAVSTDNFDRSSGVVEEQTRTTSFGILPAAIISAGRLEIMPRVGFSLFKEKKTSTHADGVEIEDYTTSSFGLGGGCGVYPRIVDGKVFRLSIGPDIWFWLDNPDGDDNNTFTWRAGLPLNVDFLVGQRVFLRLSPRLASMEFKFVDRGSDNRTVFNFLTIQSSLNASFGIFINL